MVRIPKCITNKQPQKGDLTFIHKNLPGHGFFKMQVIYLSVDFITLCVLKFTVIKVSQWERGRDDHQGSGRAWMDTFIVF